MSDVHVQPDYAAIYHCSLPKMGLKVCMQVVNRQSKGLSG